MKISGWPACDVVFLVDEIPLAPRHAVHVWAIAGGLTGGAAWAAAGLVAAPTAAEKALAARAWTIKFAFADIALNRPFERNPAPLIAPGGDGQSGCFWSLVRERWPAPASAPTK